MSWEETHLRLSDMKWKHFIIEFAIMKKRNIKIREVNMGVGTKINASRIGRHNKKHFCTGDSKNNILIWSFAEDDPVLTLYPNTAQGGQQVQTEVSAIAFTTDENRIVSGTNRGTINIWDLEKAALSCKLKGHSTSVNSFSTFPKQQNVFASGSYDTYIKLWDLRMKESTATLKGHTQQVNTLDASPDETFLASGSQDGAVKLWDLITEKLIATYTEHTAPVYCVKFHPEEMTFASAGADRTAKLFRCQPGFYRQISTTSLSSSAITGIQFSEDGSLLYTAGNDSLKAWRMGKDGLLAYSVESGWKGVQDLCMIDDNLIGIAFQGGKLSFWAHHVNAQENRPQEKKENEFERLPPIKSNRSQQLKEVKNNLKQAMNVVRNIESDERFKRNQSINKEVQSRKQEQSPIKKSFLQKFEKMKTEDAKSKEKERQVEQAERVSREQEQRINRLKAEKPRNQMQEHQAGRIEQEMKSARIMQPPEKKTENPQKKQAHRLLESVLYQDRMDASLHDSQFAAEKDHQETLNQYDMISEILKESGKFKSLVNIKMTRVKPIINWWSNNNIKSALYALNEADVGVVIDSLNAVLSNSRLKSLVTPQVAISLCRKASQVVLDKHINYVKNAISILNSIVLMFKDDLIRIKSFAPGAKVDLSRQDRIARYDRLVESFREVFKIERVRRFAKDGRSEDLNQEASILYRNLEEILRRWNPKGEPELAL